MGTYYTMFAFTDFVEDTHMKWNLGWVILAICGIQIGVNLFFLILGFVKMIKQLIMKIKQKCILQKFMIYSGGKEVTQGKGSLHSKYN